MRRSVRLVTLAALFAVIVVTTLPVPGLAMPAVHGTWHSEELDSPSDIGYPASVSCPAPDYCMMVGAYDFDDYLHSFAWAAGWNGSGWGSWTVPQPTHDAYFHSVSCADATHCLAVGVAYDHDGHRIRFAEAWDGSGWTIVATPGLASEVSCPAVDDCVAVEGRLHQRWDGTSWHDMPEIRTGSKVALIELNDVDCPATTACIAVGDDRNGHGVAERWDGAVWRTLPISSGTLYNVSCSSPDACTATGYGTAPVVERWNGSGWTSQSFGGTDGFAGDISCPLRTSCFSVGGSHNAEVAYRHWNGDEWTPLDGPDPYRGDPADMDCADGKHCQAVGTWYYTQPIAFGYKVYTHRPR